MSPRLLLPLALFVALLAPGARAQGTPPPEPPAWEGQFSDGRVTVTLYPRGDAVAGWLDVGGALHTLRAKVGPAGQLSGTFFVGTSGFGFDARLDEEVLLLKSGGKSLRLQRRVPAQGAAEANPLTKPAREAPQAGDGPDLSHVKVGQRYVYQMQNDMQMVWTVKEVGPGLVKYETSIVMGGAPIGDPTPQEWRYVAPVGNQAAPQQADVKTSRETIKIGEMVLDCLVSEASGYKSWVSMSPGSDTLWTFPGAVKTVQLSDNSVLMELVAIE